MPVAFALSCPIYSTWEGRALYLEDLYIQPPFRRLGLSGLLFQATARAALAARCARVQWSCLAWNEPAVRAYEDKIRAVPLSEWRLYRLYRADIERVAAIQLPALSDLEDGGGGGR